MLPGRARLCVLSKLLHPTASQPTTTPATSAARDADYLLDDNYLFGQNMTEHNPAPSLSGHPLLSRMPRPFTRYSAHPTVLKSSNLDLAHRGRK